MASDDTILTVSNLQAGYGLLRVLQGVSLELKGGEITVLLGPNGNGKSTLLKCLAGLLPPNSGEIELQLDGRKIDITGKKPGALVDIGITLIPEGRRLFGSLTVEENIFMGALSKKARRNLNDNLKLVYELFPVLKERRKQLAFTLSGGEQQMLALGRGLMSNPRLLLIDEPSAGLAPLLVSRVMSAIKELRQRLGITIFMAEQNLLQAIKIADKAYIMTHGKLTEQAKAVDLLDQDSVRKIYLEG